MDWLFNISDTAEWIRGLGIWAVFVSILLNIVISLFAIIPSLFLSGANAVVFGIVPGFFLSLFGETLGAAVTFWLYRLGMSKIKGLKKAQWKWLHSINHSSRKRQAILLLVARLTPLIPSGVITAVAAISKMKYMDFIIVSFLGKSPSIAIETLIGHDFLLAGENTLRLIISLLLIGLFFLLLRKRNIFGED